MPKRSKNKYSKATNLKKIYIYNFIAFLAVLFFSEWFIGTWIALIALLLSFYEIGMLSKNLEK